jgi:hypothetical protein
MSRIFAKPLCARDRRRSSKKSLNLGYSKQDTLNEIGTEKQKPFNPVSLGLVDVYCCFLYDYCK